MPRKVKISTAKKRAWDAVSKYVRTKAAVNGMCKCVTCGSWQPIAETDCGHFITKARGNAAYFPREEGLACQCRYCNRMLEGNTHLFTLYIIDTYGREMVDQLESDARQIIRYRVADYLDIETHYKEALRGLES